jgi:DNA polymerase-3 subunit psi
MGIDEYLLREPRHFKETALTGITPSEQCRLLLVVNEAPTANELSFLEKILSTLPLAIEQAQWVWQDDFSHVELTQVDWLWFCGTVPQTVEQKKTLVSTALAELMDSTEDKRALWGQIKSLKAN